MSYQATKVPARTKNPSSRWRWPDAVRGAIEARLAAGELVKDIAADYNSSPSNLSMALMRWRQQGEIALATRPPRYRGLRNSVPTTEKLRVLRDQEAGAGPDWRSDYELGKKVRAFLKDPAVKVHRAYHAHMRRFLGTNDHNIPAQILVEFDRLPEDVRRAPEIETVTGRLPIVQLAWYPGRTRPFRKEKS